MPWYVLMWMRARQRLPAEFFRRRQLRALRHRSLQRSAAVVVLPAGGRRRPAAVDAAGAGLARTRSPNSFAAARRRHDRSAAAAVGRCCRCLLLALGRQAAALRAAGAAAARALLLASSIVERTQEWRGHDGVRSMPRRACRWWSVRSLSGVFFVALAVLLYRAQPLLINVQSIFTTIAASLIAVLGALVILAAVSRNWRTAPVVIALAAAVTLPAIQYGALSSGGDDTVRQMARLVQQHRTGRRTGRHDRRLRAQPGVLFGDSRPPT